MLRNVLIVKFDKLYTVNLSLSALYMLWNVLIVKLEKLYTVNLYVSLSALYMLQYVPIVTYSCNLHLFKKKEKRKKDPYFGMGKNTKVMPQYPAIYLFLLGKGGNPYISRPYIKTKYNCAFCPAPSMQKIQIRTMRGQCTPKLPKNKYIFSVNFAPFQ